MKNLIKTKEEADELLFWIGTLQAQVLPKGRFALQSNEGYCCLGVGMACNLPEDKLPVTDTRSNEREIFGVVPDEVYFPKNHWFIKIYDHLATNYGVFVIDMNDDRGYSHKRIGNVILKTMKKEIEEAYANG